MRFYCDDNALLLQKLVLEDFSKNRLEAEYLNYI